MSAPVVHWTGDCNLMVDDVKFFVTPRDPQTSTDEVLRIVKRPDLVDQYLELIAELAPTRICELGIFEGGSTALLALLTRPEKLVAFELSPEPVAALEHLIESHGLRDSIVPLYGVDQSDQVTIERELDKHFGDTPLDLVIDDASHEVEPTEASFNVLFPRLRPGGLYIIEDWSWAHFGFGATRPGVEPLTTFVFEALVTLPQPRGLIDEIRVVRDWAVIRRGPGKFDPAWGTFDIRRICNDRGRDLVTYLRDRAPTLPG